MISDIITYLESKTTITAYVGTSDHRIYVSRRPQGDTLPSIVVDFISSDHIHHINGAGGLVQSSIQITSYSTSSLEAEQMGDAVRLVFDGWDSGDGSMGSLKVRGVELVSDTLVYNAPIDSSDAGTYSWEMDFDIWHPETIPSF